MFSRGLKENAIALLGSVILLVNSDARGYTGPNVDVDTPCYVVLATDVSGSMNYNDMLIESEEGEKRALRDDAQLVFLQFLWARPTRSYVGAVQFASKINRCFPPDSDKSQDPLMNWQTNRFDTGQVERIVCSVEPGEGPTRLCAAMDWARDRIDLARSKAEPGVPPCERGKGILILLSDGDPDNAPSQAQHRAGPDLHMATQLGEENIRIYPVIINRASVRSGRKPEQLRPVDRAAEWLMDELARRTGGNKAERLTDLGALERTFKRILDEVSVPPTPPSNPNDFLVSRFHGLVLLAGPLPKYIQLNAGTPSPGAQLEIGKGIDSLTGIGRSHTPLTRWSIACLTRPIDAKRIDEYWSGEWLLDTKENGIIFPGWVERIPDFIVQLDVDAQEQRWTHEQISVQATITPRPAIPGLPAPKAPDLTTASARPTARLLVVPEMGGAPVQTVELTPADSQHFAPCSFEIDTPGRYTVIVECRDNIRGKELVVAEASETVDVAPADFALHLHTVREPKTEWSLSSDGTSHGRRFRNGDRVYAILETDADTEVAGKIRITGSREQRYSMTTQGAGQHVTEPFLIPTGTPTFEFMLDAELVKDGRHRTVRLPVSLPLREQLIVRADFSDWRSSLWLSEVHEQEVLVRILPVSSREEAEYFAKALPEVLTGARAYIVRNDQITNIGVTCERTREAPTLVGNEVRATYRLKVTDQFRELGECHFQLGEIAAGLTSDPDEEVYQIVDASREHLFNWFISQGALDQGLQSPVETIKTGLQVGAHAQWDLRHLAVDGIRFVVTPEGGTAGDGQAIDLDIDAQAGMADKFTYPEDLDWLRDGWTCGVEAYVSLSPFERGRQELQVRLIGEPFSVTDPWPSLAETVIGDGSEIDLEFYVLETTDLPIIQCFAELVRDDSRHGDLLSVFAESATLSIEWDTARESEELADLSRQPWKDVFPQDELHSCIETTVQPRLTRSGSGTIWLLGNIIEKNGTGSHVRRVGRRVIVHRPRIQAKVYKLAPDGNLDRLLFDSDRWIDDGMSTADSPLRVSTGTQLAVDVARPSGEESSNETWAFDVSIDRVVRDGQSLDESKPLVATVPPGESSNRLTFDLSQEGEYVLRIESRATAQHTPAIELQSPTILSIDQQGEIKTIVPLPSTITSRTRRWNFEYAVRCPEAEAQKRHLPDFQFRFPVKSENESSGSQDYGEWIAGRRVVERNDAGELWYRLTPPSYLSPIENLRFGTVDFRLLLGKQTWREWPADNISPREAILKQVLFFARNADGEDVQLSVGNEPVHIGADKELVAEIDLRSAPEMAHWELLDVLVQVIGNDDGQIRSGPPDAQFLEKLDDLAANKQETEQAGISFSRSELSPNQVRLRNVVREVEDRGRPLWLPRYRGGKRFAVVVSPRFADTSVVQAVPSLSGSNDQAIAEFSDVYLFDVDEKLELSVVALGVIIVGPFLAVWAIVVQILRRRYVPGFAKWKQRVLIFDPLGKVRMNKPNNEKDATVHFVVDNATWSEEARAYADLLWALIAVSLLGLDHSGRFVVANVLRPILAIVLKKVIPILWTILKRAFWPGRSGWVSVANATTAGGPIAYVQVSASAWSPNRYKIMPRVRGGEAQTLALQTDMDVKTIKVESLSSLKANLKVQLISASQDRGRGAA